MVDLDLERFFDRVNHDVLMARVARRVKDKQMVRLIRRVETGGRTGDDFAGELSVQTPAPTNQPGEEHRGWGLTVLATRF